MGLFRIQLNGQHTQAAEPPFNSNVALSAFRPDVWQLKLTGNWKTEPGKTAGGTFTLTEKDIPRELHPLRESLGPGELSTDKRRVNRTLTVRITEDGKVELKP